MRVLILTSNKIRHKYYIQQLSKSFNVVGVISEPKVKYYNKVIKESALVREHFEKLSVYEEKYFGSPEIPETTRVLELTKDEINSNVALDFAQECNADLVFLFGTGILKDGWLDRYPNKIINLHLGLSPFYRGSATLFWPIYNNSFNCVGVTIHIAAKKVDAGEIIDRVKPDLKIGDNYYDINMKAIKSGIDSIPSIVENHLNNNKKLIVQDLSISKLYRKSDFSEETLVQALENVGEGLSKEQIKEIYHSEECNC